LRTVWGSVIDVDTLEQAPEMVPSAEHDVIVAALAVIDRSLSDFARRELVSSTEIADLLLDVRSLLTHTN
jgi:hypothetical protein